MGVFRKSNSGNNLILGLVFDSKSKRAIQIHFNESYVGNFTDKKKVKHNIFLALFEY